jgi:aerobic C4-dicarboxylate transport protein
MSECRALTNLVGNGVATLVTAKWCHELDEVKLQKALAGEAVDVEEAKGAAASA